MTRARRIAAMLWGMAALLCFVPAVAAMPPDVLTLDSAWARLEPDGAAAREGTVDLARRWDRDFPGLGGHASYRVMLPPHTGAEPMAVLFTRVGNQALVQVNGSTVQRWGTLGDPEFDATKTMRMVTLPAGLMHADGPNELRVEVTLQAQRLGGLSVVLYGPQDTIQDLYDAQTLWRDFAMLVFAAGLVGMGSLTAVLWWRQRDPFYGWFSLAAFLGVVRVLDRAWPDTPIPWPALGVIAATTYAAHIALICRFILLALGPVNRVLDRAIDVVIVVSVLLHTLAFALHLPVLMTIGFAILPVLALAVFVLVLRAALSRRSARAWVLAGLMTGAIALGVHDVLLVRVAGASGLVNTYLQHGMFAFVLLMAWFIVERYSRTVEKFEALNADLTRRVDERERQLVEAFESLRVQQHHQSVARERQRIMREIHDGVGSHLVGLLNMVTRSGADPTALTEQVQMALDEMRMAVDSLQPSHDDLSTLLATLRFRLQPRLQSAGIEVVWDVAELPPLRQLSPAVVLHVQRILLESFTNVLKHAHASQVTVRVRWHDESESQPTPRLVLQITDNGVGLRADAPAQAALAHGRGVNNMRARAATIGAVLRVEPAPGGGVCVLLEWRATGATPDSGDPAHQLPRLGEPTGLDTIY